MLIQADAFHLPYRGEYFHAIIFSPPYWGLRKYQGDQGAEPFGLESTPERHIERSVEYMREVRRVLRPDGVVWANIGDCFAGSGGENANTGLGSGDRSGLYRNNPRKTKIAQGSLMLMPHRLAIALQADGWIVRNDLVWWKRNPMPESVAGWRWERRRTEVGRKNEQKKQATNVGPNFMLGENYPFDTNPVYEYGDDYVLRKSSWRHTRSHEYVFQLVKGMGYYCNQEAVREKAEYGRKGWHDPQGTLRRAGGNPDESKDAKWTGCDPSAGRNPRSVLDVPTAPYKGSHYATFPPKLIAPLIRASVPRRCCPECGMAWAPVVEKEYHNQRIGENEKYKDEAFQTNVTYGRGEVISNVTDYRPTCECGVTEHEPGIVLDIFAGSGTVPMVANELGVRSVGMDISYEYLDEQARYRANWGEQKTKTDDLPLFRSDVLPDVENES